MRGIPSHQEILRKAKESPDVAAITKLATEFFAAFAEAAKKDLKGEKGNQGEQGKEGKSGIQGKPGPEGKAGPQGKPGPEGKSGKTVTKEDLIPLIKSLLPKDASKDQEKIIRDLFAKLEKSITDRLAKMEDKKRRTVSGGKAGGMGDPQHETFNITTATVTITTNYPIAAMGNAIFKCAYQGQTLQKGTHFTVGIDNQTVTFVPAVRAQFENSTVMELTYAR